MLEKVVLVAYDLGGNVVPKGKEGLGAGEYGVVLDF